jgi:hypothetical protein
VSVEIPPNILKNILDNSRKRKADGSIDCRQCKVHASAHSRCCDTAEMPPGEDLGDVEGDRQVKLEEYCTWGLAQVKSDRWREALQTGNRFALNQFLDLNSILQHPSKLISFQILIKDWGSWGLNQGKSCWLIWLAWRRIKLTIGAAHRQENTWSSEWGSSVVTAEQEVTCNWFQNDYPFYSDLKPVLIDTQMAPIATENPLKPLYSCACTAESPLLALGTESQHLPNSNCNAFWCQPAFLPRLLWSHSV